MERHWKQDWEEGPGSAGSGGRGQGAGHGRQGRNARDVSETDHYGAGDETFHDFHANRKERTMRKPIDFIFVNDRVRVLSHGTINDFRDGLASSDHFPVTAEIVLLDAPENN